MPLRLCICTSLSLSFANGGVDRIIKLARNVSKQGVNVFLVSRSREKSISAMILDKDEFIEFRNGIGQNHKYPVYIRFLLPGIVKFLQETANLLFAFLTRTPGSEVSYSYLLDPYLIVKLLFVCKRESIDVIQCEFPFTTLSSLAVKRILGIPLVYDAHNIESQRIGSIATVNGLHPTIMKQIELSSCNYCDSIFTVSKEDKRQLVDWGVTENKITIVPNSVDISEFSPKIDGSKIRARHGLANAFVLIFHGFLSYPPNREAVSFLLSSVFSNVLNRDGSTYLLLVGENPQLFQIRMLL